MNLDKDVVGVYIVTQQEGDSLSLRHFYNLVRGDEVKVEVVNINPFHIDQHPLSEDGQPIDYSPGSLFQIAYEPKSTKHAFRFINVEPQGEAIIQYEYALSKLGLGIEPKFDRALLAVDGQFRSLIKDVLQGKNEKAN